MIDNKKTLLAYKDIISHQGGGLLFSGDNYYPLDSNEDFFTAASRGSNNKNFYVSIYNQELDRDEVTLVFLVNPTDMTVGSTFVSSEVYTRKGWLPTLWGKNLKTLTISSGTAGFYVEGTGLTTYMRRNSLGFINLMTLISMFKNNGSYFLSNDNAPSFFNNDSYGRVINVLDLIKISYDGVSYLGSFSTLSIEETAEMPYRLQFTFEFIVSGLYGDKIEGHLRKGGNETKTSIYLKSQGSDNSLAEIIMMDQQELNATYQITDQNDPNFKEYQESLDARSASYNQFRLYSKEEKAGKIIKHPEHYPKNIYKPFESLSLDAQNSHKKLAKELGISLDAYIAQIVHEAGGFYDNLVQNPAPASSVTGLLQYSNGSAIDMVPKLLASKVISQKEAERILAASGEQAFVMCSIVNKDENQPKLIEAYLESKIVVIKKEDGSKYRTNALTAIKNANTEEEKRRLYETSIFYPAYTDESLDKLLPEYVRLNNPRIRTMRDYTNRTQERLDTLTVENSKKLQTR